MMTKAKTLDGKSEAARTAFAAKECGIKVLYMVGEVDDRSITY